MDPAEVPEKVEPAPPSEEEEVAEEVEVEEGPSSKETVKGEAEKKKRFKVKTGKLKRAKYSEMQSGDLPDTITGKTLKACTLVACNFTATRSHDIKLDKYVQKWLEEWAKHRSALEVAAAAKAMDQVFSDEAKKEKEKLNDLEEENAELKEEVQKQKIAYQALERSLSTLEEQISVIEQTPKPLPTPPAPPPVALDGCCVVKGTAPQSNRKVKAAWEWEVVTGLLADGYPFHNANGNWNGVVFVCPANGMYRAELRCRMVPGDGGVRQAKLMVEMPPPEQEEGLADSEDEEGSSVSSAQKPVATRVTFVGNRAYDKGLMQEQQAFKAKVPVLWLPKGTVITPLYRTSNPNGKLAPKACWLCVERVL